MQLTMSEPRDPRHADGTFFVGVISGGVIGLILGAALTGLVSYNYMKRRLTDAYHSLVPVVVAAQDIPANTPITFDHISQRSMPEQFVPSSIVKPDSATRIIHQRINVSLKAGDPLFWHQFEGAKPQKQAPCLLAARDIPVGAKLTEEDLEDRELATDLATASFIRQPERPQILGQVVSTAFRKGDPILWTHFQTGTPSATGTAKE
jgi:Flp pilus assembly protein CpaB